MAARHEEACYKKQIFGMYFLLAKDDRTMTSGWQGAAYFRRYPAGSWFQRGDFVQEKMQGATVEQLHKKKS